MQNEFIRLGEVFKQRRGEKNLSLREIENATSIRVSYLEAIEEGHLGKLISPVYAQGFIKKYATFLGMDGDQIIREHPHVMKILNERKMPMNQDFSLGIGSLEVRGSPGTEVKWIPNLLWVGLSVFVILCAWFFARYLGIF